MRAPACPPNKFIADDISWSIQRSSGINPAKRLLRSGIPADELLDQLAAHKVGFVREEMDFNPSPHPRIFSDNDLAWYCDDDKGYYTVIDGHVYDVTGEILPAPFTRCYGN